MSALDDEIRHHIAERAELLMAEGWEPEAALREARRRFGDAGRIRREMARARSEGRGPGHLGPARSAAAGARYALRGLAKSPLFTAATVATLALGLGAASSIFAVLDAVLLRPLAYRDAERWVEVTRRTPSGGFRRGLPADRYGEWQEAFDGLLGPWLAYSRESMVRTDGSFAEPLAVVAATPGTGTLLGMPLLRGRGFTPQDAAPGASAVALLTEAYWRRHGADADVLGRTLRLDSGPVTVIGIVGAAAPGAKFPPMADRPDLWLPMRDDFSFADRAWGAPQSLWARLPEGLPLAAARARTDALAPSFEERGMLEPGWRIRLTPLDAHRANPDVRRALWMLGATVVAIFLIALVNGLNLVLVRSSARAHEVAVRRAIGASRRRLVGELLAEGVAIGVLGGAAAVALAWGAVAGIGTVLPNSVAFFSPHLLAVEGRTLAFAFGSSLVAGTVLGLVPALSLLRQRAPALASGARADDAPTARRLRGGLVVAQVALCMTLLAGAGLLFNSFARLVSVDPGFDYERVALGDLQPSPSRYPDGAARAEFARRMKGALAARREVEGVGMSTGGFSFGTAMQAEGEAAREDQPALVPYASVGADWFDVMGVTLVAGRPLVPSDYGSDNVVIDRDLARFLWGERPAVGQRLRLSEEHPWLTVVGVAEELRLMGRDERDGPYQFLRPLAAGSIGSVIEFAMRTSGPPEALLPAFQETLRAVDPQQSYWRLRSAADALAEEEQKPRFVVTLMTLLAAVAVALAAVGLYGVLAYSVTRRDRELGIRMALGAGRGRVLRSVLARGLTLAALGVGLGIVAALQLAGIIEPLLYRTDPRDASTFAATAALLLAVATLACLLPARRAVRVDPVEVMRAE